jgi:hypothetical protein
VGQVPGIRESIGKAYDSVLDDPLGGPADEVLAVLQSPEFERILLERGPALFAKDGELIVSGKYIQDVTGFPRSGGGIVKIIWRHGEKSKEAPRLQVTREDVMRLPEILEGYESIKQKYGRREWAVPREDGTNMIVVVGEQKGRQKTTVVSVFINENPKRQLSKKREAPASPDGQGSPEGNHIASTGDTPAGTSSNRLRQGQGLAVKSLGPDEPEVNPFAVETPEEFTPAPPLSENTRNALEDMGADPKTGTTLEEIQATGQAVLGLAPPEEAAALREAQDAEISRLRMEEEGYNIMGCIMEVIE